MALWNMARQMRIYKRNKINKLYIIDFVKYFVSV